MKMRPFGAVLVAVASLVLVASPASADYVVKSGDTTPQQLTFKSFINGIIHWPGHVMGALFSGVPTALNETNSGALDVTCVGGCALAGNTLGTQGTVTAADAATTSTAGQGGVSAISGSPTAGSFVTYALNGASGGTLTISGTFVATSQIEASYDNGASYRPASALLRGTSLLTSAVTGPGAFSIDLNGVTQLRVRATAYTSGTQTVNFTYSAAAGLTKILNGVKQVDSTGADATDTTNHAVKVNVVAGGAGGGAVTVADGADVAKGTTTDGSTANTEIGLLKGIKAAVQDVTTAAPVKIDQTGTNNAVQIVGSLTAGSKAPGTAASNSDLIGCIFETALPTLTTTQQAAAHCDSSGRIQFTDTQNGVKLDTLHTDINSATPAGTNIIGKVGIDQTTDGTTNGVHLVAGTAVAGKFSTDQTTHGTTDQVASDLTKVAGTSILTNTGATGAGSPRVTVAVDSATVAGSASLPAGANTIGGVTPVPATSGGLSACRVVTGTTGFCKASAGQVFHVSAANLNAALRYVHLYNKASAPTLGTDTPIVTIELPLTGHIEFDATALGAAFSTGIAWGFTTDDIAVPATAGASTDLHMTLLYK